MSEWAEIRHFHVVGGVSKRELARRFGRDVKTIRRALDQKSAPVVRASGPRRRALDQHREQIEELLTCEPKITARRVMVLLRREHQITVGLRAVQKYVSGLRRVLGRPEAFVHRSPRPGQTLEIDFGESRAVIAGVERRVWCFVATLPWSNVHFAKAYLTQRLESWLDGIESACRWLGGLPERLVLDNTSVAVREVLAGRERRESLAFAGYRGELCLGVDFCAPGRGNEKGSVEGAVKYVKANCFRPCPQVSDLAELNALILAELEEDLSERRVADGRTCAVAWVAEREHLRPLPAHWPEAARVESRVVNKFGHVRAADSTYSVPIAYAYRSAIVKLYPNRVEIAVGAEVVATHARSFELRQYVLNPLHVLPLLAHKARAASEATALSGGRVAPIFERLRRELCRCLGARKGDREWVETLQLAGDRGWEDLEAAVALAFEQGSARRSTVVRLLKLTTPSARRAEPLELVDDDLAGVVIAEPDLCAYDVLGERVR